MSWMNSWIGFKDVARDDIPQALEMESTDIATEPYSGLAGLCLNEFPNGWTIVFSQDFEWASGERVRDLSRLGLVLGCQFEDKVEMTSTACAVDRGVELWWVHHDNTKSICRLGVSGRHRRSWRPSMPPMSGSSTRTAARNPSATICTTFPWRRPRPRAAIGTTTRMRCAVHRPQAHRRGGA